MSSLGIQAWARRDGPGILFFKTHAAPSLHPSTGKPIPGTGELKTFRGSSGDNSWPFGTVRRRLPTDQYQNIQPGCYQAALVIYVDDGKTWAWPALDEGGLPIIAFPLATTWMELRQLYSDYERCGWLNPDYGFQQHWFERFVELAARLEVIDEKRRNRNSYPSGINF